MNKSEIAEKAAREMADKLLGADWDCDCPLFDDMKAIVERAIAESQVPPREELLKEIINDPANQIFGVSLNEAYRRVMGGKLGDGEPSPPPTETKRSCNRHEDCEQAEAEVLARRPDLKKSDISLSFHCHDEDCEDCFWMLTTKNWNPGQRRRSHRPAPRSMNF